MICSFGLNPPALARTCPPPTDIYVAHHGRTGVVLPAGADRVHGRIAGRAWREIRSGDQARRVGRHGPIFNFTGIEALDAAGGTRRADTQEALVKQFGQMLADPKAREAVLAASERVVGQLGGALERTLTSLEPYLLQLRLEMGAANA
jgi:hypothetical protein